MIKPTKIGQGVNSSTVGKAKGAFSETEIVLDESQDRTEVVADIINVTCWSVSRDKDHGYPETQLVAAFW